MPSPGSRPIDTGMTYATLMVHCDLDPGTDNRLKIAANLAERFNAVVIGIAALPESAPLYFDFAQGSAAARVQEEVRASIESRLQMTEERFRKAMEGRARQAEWRAAIGEPLAFVTRECRAADLLIAGKDPEFVTLDPGDLVMAAGRPVLLTPGEIHLLSGSCVLIAWRDTREARCAVMDALPLLRLCQKAVVAEIDESKDLQAANRRLAGVVSWLEWHGINAASRSEPLRESAAAQLEAIAAAEAADLVVAGAYGHGRLRERVLGGATKQFLHLTARCHLLSH